MGGFVRRVAVFALVALAATGCSDSDPSSTPSVTSSSAGPSRSAAPAAPAPSSSYWVPPEAREQTDAGAIAFVRFYLSQANAAWTRPDSSLLPPLFEAGCQSCQALQQGALALVTSHQRYVSDPIIVGETGVDIPTGGVQGVITVKVEQKAVNTVDASGRVVMTSEAKIGEYLIAVVWQEGRWLIYGMA